MDLGRGKKRARAGVDPGARAASVAAVGGVKVHRFVPSMRYIMTVVGRKGEHWVDPDAGFCSCPAFYFAMTTGSKRAGCYHLDSARLAAVRGMVEEIVFEDGEFDGFVRGLVADMG